MPISLYRKYRPQTFDQVVGQDQIERTLRNAVAEGNMSHAYLFCGPRGTGKTTTARLLAKALLCESGPTANPCGQCAQCQQVASGTHPDVYELDAASRTGVDNVREEIIERVDYAPTSGRYKIYIIDEVHMLSTGAFNALLKTLEEPPAHVIFILCTTDPRKVIDTVVSRCQRFDFHRIGSAEIVANLRMIADNEGIQCEDAALEMIARSSLGGMRDAITTFEQLSVFTGKNITAQAAEGLLGEVQQTQLSEICGLIATRNLAGCFAWVATFVEGGTDIAVLAHDLTAYMRNLYVVSLTGGVGVDDVTGEELEVYRQRARLFEGPERLARILMILADLNMELRNATDPRLSLELALMRMAHPTTDLTLEALAERIEALESALAHGQFAAQAAAPAPVIPQMPPAASAAPVVPRPAPMPEAAAPAPAKPAAQPAVPVAAPAPAAPAQSATSALDQAVVTRKWAEAARIIGASKKSLAGALPSVRALLDAGGDSIVLELPQGSTLMRNMLDSSDNRKLIGDTIAKIFGRPVRYTLTMSTTAPPPPPAMPVEEAPSEDLFEVSAPEEPEPEYEPDLEPAPAPAVPEVASAPAELEPVPAPAAAEPAPAPAEPAPAPAPESAPEPVSAAPAASPEPYDEYVFDDDDEDEYVPDFEDDAYDDGFGGGYADDGGAEQGSDSPAGNANDGEVSDELPADLANMIFGAFDRAHGDEPNA